MLSSTTNKYQQQTNISTSACRAGSIVDQTWRMSMVLGDGNERGGRGPKVARPVRAEMLTNRT